MSMYFFINLVLVHYVNKIKLRNVSVIRLILTKIKFLIFC